MTVDLASQVLGLSTYSVAPGSTITVRNKVFNYGSTQGSAGNIGVFLSTNSTISSSDTLLVYSNLFNYVTAGGNSGDLYTTVTIPSNLAGGTYWIGIIPDYDNRVAETNESNNASAGVSFTVVAPSAPDLVVDTVSLGNSSVAAGGSTTVSYHLYNQGNAAAAPSNTRIYLSTDSTITTGDTVLLTTVFTSSISGGYYIPSTDTITLPGNLAPGTYYIGVIADIGGAVTESNENNNASVGVAITVPATPRPDLVVDTVSLGNSSVVPGGSTTVSYHLYNQGNATAAPSNTRIYLSTDSTITTADTVLLTTVFTNSISGGYYIPTTDTVTLPVNLAPGTYYIGVIADIGGAVTESNENNNASVGVAVTVPAAPRPDLVVDTVSLGSSSVAAGASTTISYHLYNQGNATASPSNTRVYLSTDSTITTADTVLLTTVFTNSISAGFFISNTSTISLPGNLAPGTYYVGVIADIGGAVIEANENNNASVGVAVTVPNVAPVINSNGGADTATLLAAENTTYVTTVSASDATMLTYSLAGGGGADQGLFQINAVSGELYFLTPPDFEAPTDSNGDNYYVVEVRATDTGGLSDFQTITVRVTNVVEPVNGNDGDNTLFGTAGVDPFYGFLGEDTVSYANATAGVSAGLLSSTKNSGFAAGDTYNSIENLTGSAYGDRLTGNTLDNVLDGGAGADALDGGLGFDTASYASSITGLTVDMTTPRNNTGNAAGDTFKSIERLIGSGYDDRLTGGKLADTILGMGGNDILAGGAGLDALTGGDGIDTFLFTSVKNGIDTITDFAPGEHIGISKTGFKINPLVDFGRHDLYDFVEQNYFVSNISGTAATAVGHGQFVLDQTLDQLFWDSDGAGRKAAILIAQFSTNVNLQATDFLLS